MVTLIATDVRLFLPAETLPPPEPLLRAVLMTRNCEGTTRRDCLKLGLGALFGGGLAQTLRLRAGETASTRQAKSCILIWMDGGPTHYETLDPKPDAPSELRGEFKPIATQVPGLQLSEH